MLFERSASNPWFQFRVYRGQQQCFHGLIPFWRHRSSATMASPNILSSRRIMPSAARAMRYATRTLRGPVNVILDHRFRREANALGIAVTTL